MFGMSMRLFTVPLYHVWYGKHSPRTAVFFINKLGLKNTKVKKSIAQTIIG